MPLLFLRKFEYFGYFSGVVLVFTVFAIGIVLYLSIDIATMSVSEAVEKYPGLEMTEDDRDYTYFDAVMLPIFTAVHMNVFEGT